MDYISDLVSVIIPTYKRSELLSRAIYSVLNQTYKEIEVLVVNDNISAEDSYSQALYQLIDGIHDERLHLINQEKHINGAAARNAGIRAAKGEFIAFLDDDDYWELQKIEVQVEQFRRLDRRWGMVTCLNILRKQDQIVSTTLPYRDGNLLLAVLERRIGIGTGSALILRTALDDAGYFDEELIRHQDLQLFANITSKYKTKLVRRYLHNIDVTDGRNRPDAEKLKMIKAAYYRSIETLLNSLSPAQRRRVFVLNNFEVAYAFFKSGDRKTGLHYALGIFRSPVTLYLAMERSVRKICERKFCGLLLRRYSD